MQHSGIIWPICIYIFPNNVFNYVWPVIYRLGIVGLSITIWIDWIPDISDEIPHFDFFFKLVVLQQLLPFLATLAPIPSHLVQVVELLAIHEDQTRVDEDVEPMEHFPPRKWSRCRGSPSTGSVANTTDQGSAKFWRVIQWCREIPRQCLPHLNLLQISTSSNVQGDPSGRFKPPAVIDLKVPSQYTGA